MVSFEELVRSNKIKFKSYGKELDIEMDDYGEDNCRLARHLVLQSNKHMAITGEGLEEYLKEPKNLYELADFLIELSVSDNNQVYPRAMSFHVEVDIDKMPQYYAQPKENPVVSGGNKIGDAAGWVPELPYFEKLWNMALCNSMCEAFSNSGYEPPMDENAFRCDITEHTRNYVIGTKEQLQRYKKYALEKLDCMARHMDELRNDPESMFINSSLLYRIEMLAREAKEIADNINVFSK